MAQRAYEVFEHTADIGLHAFGSTLPELFILHPERKQKETVIQKGTPTYGGTPTEAAHERPGVSRA